MLKYLDGNSQECTASSYLSKVASSPYSHEEIVALRFFPAKADLKSTIALKILPEKEVP